MEMVYKSSLVSLSKTSEEESIFKIKQSIPPFPLFPKYGRCLFCFILLIQNKRLLGELVKDKIPAERSLVKQKETEEPKRRGRKTHRERPCLQQVI